MEANLLKTWAGQEVCGAKLKDRRQYNNLARMCLRLRRHPSLSFSAACGPAVRKAAWRLFSSQDIDLLHGHAEKTAQRCQGNELLLVAEDTTDLNYNTHPETEGLGRLGGPSNVRGLAIHTALAMLPGGEPLGLLGQHIWAPVSTQHRTGSFLRKLPIEQKESYKWIRTLKWIDQHLAHHQGQVLVVGDREGDFYEHFIAPRPVHVHLLVRALHLRRNVLFEGEKTSLQNLANQLPVAGQMELQITKAKKRTERIAQLQISFGSFVCPPSAGRIGEPIELSLVVIKEIHRTVKSSEKPIEWYLLCTQPIDSLQAAQQLINHYKNRWVIERFHYVLKQGLKAEKLQFDTFTRLANALKVCSIVAWYLLKIAYLAKRRPKEPATRFFEPLDIQLLKATSQKEIKSVLDLTLALGKLVGFVPSKKQPLPGEKLLWQASQILLNMKTGFLLNN